MSRRSEYRARRRAAYQQWQREEAERRRLRDEAAKKGRQTVIRQHRQERGEADDQ